MSMHTMLFSMLVLFVILALAGGLYAALRVAGAHSEGPDRPRR